MAIAWLSDAFAEPPMAIAPVLLADELAPIATLVSPVLVAPMPITTDLGLLPVLVALVVPSPQITLSVSVS